MTDGGYLQAGQAREDMTYEYQDGEDSQGRDPR
jgi:hypothetical protein